MVKRTAVAKSNQDLDRIQCQRVQAFMKSNGFQRRTIDNIFLSERVSESINEPKIFLYSYDIQKILSYLPLAKNIYVSVCPKCVSRERLNTFKPLVERGAIVPALTSPYSVYPGAVQRIVASHDHMSCFEFDAYRSVVLRNSVDRMICSHCAGMRRDEILKIMKKSKVLLSNEDDIGRVMHNLFPFIYPDFELLDALQSAAKRESKIRIEELVRLSYVINSIRSSEAFNAQIVMDESDIRKIPKGFAKATDEALRLSVPVNKQVSDGLGLTIPTDIPIERYIELARDFQPRISTIIGNILGDDRKSDELTNTTALNKEIMKINMEIERVKGLKRHLLLESAVSFYSSNRALVSTAFIAGSLGRTSLFPNL
jgi:hypothetical protein